jgi:hypothetical protein
MAVYASHVALLDLGKDAWPTPVDQETADLGELLAWIAVVEFKDNRICVAAVHAGMRGQVHPNAASILFPPASHLRHRAADVVRPVCKIVRTSVGRVTHAAVGIEQPATLVGEGEVGRRLVE